MAGPDMTPGPSMISLNSYINTSTFEIKGLSTANRTRLSQKAYQHRGGQWSMQLTTPKTKHRRKEEQQWCHQLNNNFGFDTQKEAETTTNIINVIRFLHSQQQEQTARTSSSDKSGKRKRVDLGETSGTGTTADSFAGQIHRYRSVAHNNWRKRQAFKEQNYAFAKTLDNPDMYKEWFDQITRMSKRTVQPAVFNPAKTRILNKIKSWKRRMIRDKANLDRHIFLKKVIATGSLCDLLVPIDSTSNKKKKKGRHKKKLFKSNITEHDVTWTVEKTFVCCALAKHLLRTKLHDDLALDSDVFKTMEDACQAVSPFAQRSDRTILLWWQEFTVINKNRFSESYRGKYMRATIFDDNKAMKKEAVEWLHDRIMAKNTKANPNSVFRMKDWEDYLNKEGGLLDRWDVPNDTLHRVNLFQDEGYTQTKPYLTVSPQTAKTMGEESWRVVSEGREIVLCGWP